MLPTLPKESNKVKAALLHLRGKVLQAKSFEEYSLNNRVFKVQSFYFSKFNIEIVCF